MKSLLVIASHGKSAGHCESWEVCWSLRVMKCLLVIASHGKFAGHCESWEVCWSLLPQLGTVDAEMKVPSVENSELKSSPFKA